LAVEVGVTVANQLVLTEQVETLILSLRGQKVLLDADLARLYKVSTRRLNEQVKRNSKRFPDDFVFRLTPRERADLLDRFARFTRLKHSKTLPYAFTEHGAIMAASVLKSPRAVEVSVFVVRAFIKLRELLFTHKELARKFTELESRLANHDVAIQQLLAAIRQLMDVPATPPKPRIGFR
jgi:hypothetical protein